MAAWTCWSDTTSWRHKSTQALPAGATSDVESTCSKPHQKILQRFFAFSWLCNVLLYVLLCFTLVLTWPAHISPQKRCLSEVTQLNDSIKELATRAKLHHQIDLHLILSRISTQNLNSCIHLLISLKDSKDYIMIMIYDIHVCISTHLLSLHIYIYTYTCISTYSFEKLT